MMMGNFIPKKWERLISQCGKINLQIDESIFQYKKWMAILHIPFFLCTFVRSYSVKEQFL